MEKKLDIVVLGCGGTGSYFLKEFSRYLLNNTKSRKLGKLSIVDGDIVEAKNLQRQAYCEDDINQSKAAVLAGALTDAFGGGNFEWKAYRQYLLKKEDFERFVGRDRVPVIIGCVDNHAARLVTEEYVRCADNCIYIDSANEFSMGEVVVCAKRDGKMVGKFRSDIFPQIKEGDLRDVTQLSCTELNDVAPQHITANMTAGLIILDIITTFLEEGRLATGVTVFDAHRMSMRHYESEVSL